MTCAKPKTALHYGWPEMKRLQRMRNLQQSQIIMFISLCAILKDSLSFYGGET